MPIFNTCAQKTIIFFFLIILSISNKVIGQYGGSNPSIVWVKGSFCVNSTSVFTMNNPNCTNGGANWYIREGTNGVDYILEPSGYSLSIKWLKPITITSIEAYTPCNTKAFYGSTVNVSAVPNVTVSANVSICKGTTTTLTAGGGTSYSWSPSTGLSSTSGSSVIASPLVTTTYTVTATTGSCTNSTSVTVTVKEDPIAKIIEPTTDPSICEGQNVTLKAQTDPRYSYSWIKVGTTGSVGSSSSLLVTTPGTYMVNVTLNGCTVKSESRIVTVNKYPVVSVTPSPAIICAGQSIVLTASGADTYTWTPSTGLNITRGSVVTASPSVTTTYTVTGTKNGCSTSYPFKVTVNPLPSAGIEADGITTIQSGDQVLLKSTTTLTDYKYQWQLEGKDIPDAFNSTFAAKSSGNYTLVVTTKSTNCSKTSNSINVKVLDYNWIKETTVLVKDIKTPDAVDILEIQNSGKSINWNYFDGLGRPMQSISVQASPGKNDIVQPIIYDSYGRESTKYLPFTANNVKDGWFKENIIDPKVNKYTGIAAPFYDPAINNKIAGDTRHYSETIFEPSPLNRPHKEFGPGHNWNDKPIEHAYFTNIHGTGVGQERIIAWTINGSGMPVRYKVPALNNSTGLYPTGALYVKSLKDEHGKESREYTNIQGQVILKKVQLSEINPATDNREHWLQTYYIYDDFGNLRYVLQPELVYKIMGDLSNNLNPDEADLKNFAFQYKYDERQRLAEKKVPGADWVYMIYDSRDRLILTQDGNQRSLAKKQWTFTKYDQLNRPVLTGIYTHTTSLVQSQMQTYVNSQIGTTSTTSTTWFETYVGNVSGNIHGYNNSSFPKVSIPDDYLTVTYYDNYNFRTLYGSGYTYVGNDLAGLPTAEYTRTTGLVTGGKVKILETGEAKWIKSINYYNDRYLPIQNISDNYLNGKDRVSTFYNFPGWVMNTKHTHTAGTTSITTLKDFEYDHAGRLEKIWHTVNNGTTTTAPRVLLASHSYNELGELVDKKLHVNGTEGLQSIDYRYNIRGWLTHINNSKLIGDNGITNNESNDYFGMELIYNGTMGDFPLTLNQPFQNPFKLDFHNPSSVMMASKENVPFSNAWTSVNTKDIVSNTADLLKEANEKIEASIPKSFKENVSTKEKTTKNNTSIIENNEKSIESLLEVQSTEIRINTGGGTYTSSDGKSYIADTYSSGGKFYTNAKVTSISGTTNPTLYLTEYSALTNLGSFSYAIPVATGNYKVRLHFAEIWFGATGGGAGGAGKRVFSVNIEGVQKLQNFDIWSEVGAMAAIVKEFDILNVNDGNINIDFSASVDQPKISAIEIIPIVASAVPSPPQNLKTTATTVSSVSLSWSDVADETSFVIEYKLQSETVYTALPALSANTVTYTHTGLKSNTLYVYRIKAVNASGSSAFSNLLEVRTGTLATSCSNISPFSCNEVIVNLPFNLTFSGSENYVKDKNNTGTGFRMVLPHTASLTTPSDPAIPGYEPSKLEVANGRLLITTTPGIMSVNPATSTNTNSQVNALGVGINASSQKINIETTIINPPAATNNFEQAGIYFGLNEDNYIKLVVVATSSGRARIQLNREINAISTTSDEINSVVLTLSSSTVKLRTSIDPTTNTVEGFYTINNGAETRLGSLTIPADFTNGLLLPENSSNLSFAGIFATHRRATNSLVYVFDDFKITSQEILPVAPRNFTSSSSTTSSINLSWTEVSNAMSYLLEYKKANDANYIQLQPLPGGTTSYNHTGLLAGTTYNYRIKAENSLGGSGYSIFDGSTLPSNTTAPTAPSDFKVSAGGTTSLKLEWTDNATNETGYVVEVLNNEGNNWTILATLAAGTTSYTHSGLPANTTRQYKVKAINGGSSSAYTDVKSGKTTAAEPGIFTFTPQYNGNIAAVKWASHGGSDLNKEKSYVYGYDAVNRLTRSNYAVRSDVNTQLDRGGFNENLNYDLNGNILSIKRSGLAPVVTLIDDLDMNRDFYTGNQLMRVEDGTNNHAGFKNGNAGSNDYDYDKNGNMTYDNNKGITEIKYNHLNLPDKVTMKDGKHIEYIYDATGQKLAQRVFENSALVKQTTYIGGIIYEKEGTNANKLVMMQHEEGRVVPDAASPGNYEYQYHLKDHLGNVRVTFTSKPKVHEYKLNYEVSVAFNDDRDMFTETENTKKDAVFNHTTGGDHSQLLTGNPSAKIGSVIAIPVGAGDKINAHVQAIYKAASNSDNTAAAIAPLLMAALTGTSGTAFIDGASSAINNSYGSSSMITNAAYGYDYNKDAPLAFINLLFIPDKPISTIAKADFSFKQININSTQAHEKLELQEFTAKEKGVVIIYLSNENSTFKEVYFDDLSITLNEHAVIQEDDYYPFGLTFNSFKRITYSANRFLYNGKELQEETNWYDYHARQYDPKIGRWTSIDPLSYEREWLSSYNYVQNNPVLRIDPDGMLDEFNYNIETGNFTWVSDKGGNETQYVNIVNNDGEVLNQGSVAGDIVFAYKLREGVVLTNYDANFDDKSYNRNSGYEYTYTEFKQRNKWKNSENVISTFLNKIESEGNAIPLSYSEEEKLYGYTTMRLKMIISAVDQSYDVMPSFSTGNISPRKFGTPIRGVGNTSISPLKGNTGVTSLTNTSSWNKFLKANKGVYSGQGWQKRAAADYYKSSFYKK